MDFTIEIYKQIIISLKQAGYAFLSFEEFMLDDGKNRCVVLRHDIDKRPENALHFAEIEHELNIKASYYFRVVSGSWDEAIMKQIVDLGHEVSYHYEDLSIFKGNYEKAIKHFEFQLKKFREIYPAKTICMHGSPLSKWDNRKIWEKYDYRDYGIIAEPYFDVDYNKVLYLTDTGRTWRNNKSSVRDKVVSNLDVYIKKSEDIIKNAEKQILPFQIIVNTHPQRWFKPGPLWLIEFVTQNIKNVIKSALLVVFTKK